MSRILAILAVCYLNITYAQTDNEFESFFNSVESISANFKQSTYDEHKQLLASSSGSLVFKRPNQLIWNIDIPNKQKLIINNQDSYLIDYDLEQAVKQQINNLDSTPLYWLINKPNTLKNMPKFSHKALNISWYKTDNQQNIAFGFQNNKLLAINLKNELEQIVVLKFEDLTTNQIIKSSTFNLDIPKDFDVIK